MKTKIVWVTIGVICLVALYFYAKPDSSSKKIAGPDSTEVVQAAGRIIAVAARLPKQQGFVLVIDDENPKSVEVPYGYKINAVWGDAPLDIRLNGKEWLRSDKVSGHNTDCGQDLHTVEFRLSQDYNWRKQRRLAQGASATGFASVEILFTENKLGTPNMADLKL